MSNVIDCNILKLKLQSHYYVLFQTNTLETGTELFIPPTMS